MYLLLKRQWLYTWPCTDHYCVILYYTRAVYIIIIWTQTRIIAINVAQSASMSLTHWGFVSNNNAWIGYFVICHVSDPCGGRVRYCNVRTSRPDSKNHFSAWIEQKRVVHTEKKNETKRLSVKRFTMVIAGVGWPCSTYTYR